MQPDDNRSRSLELPLKRLSLKKLNAACDLEGHEYAAVDR